LVPYAFNGCEDYDVWDKVGQAVGNLQALDSLNIYTPNYHYPYLNGHDGGLSQEWEILAHDHAIDWEILARILSHVRQKINVTITDFLAWDPEEARLFARAIRGHPTMRRFEDGRNEGDNFPYESLDALYSALATLPALESLVLSNGGRRAQPENESTLAHPESLTNLLRVPSLKSVYFDRFTFTPALCKATANAFMERTAITKLVFEYCSFSAEASAVMMGNGLSRSISVSHIEVISPRDQALYGALALALPLNSTLQALSFKIRHPSNDGLGAHVDCSPMFLAMRKNTGLKTLKVLYDDSHWMNESISTAIQIGLGTNATLENLTVSLRNVTADLQSGAFSFLRTNKALKALMIIFGGGVAETCLSAFRIDIAVMLQENTSLESLSIEGWGNKSKADEYVAIVTAIQPNKTLKTLSLCEYPLNRSLQLNDVESKQMASLLKKNYGLERLPVINENDLAWDVGAILRLNGAGRRYLIEDGSSISKGVEVLIGVNNNINCVFLHLLENPRLCDRSAVEKGSAGESNSELMNAAAGSDGGKREQASVHEGRELRRRLV
jgi:hypothetical protein